MLGSVNQSRLEGTAHAPCRRVQQGRAVASTREVGVGGRGIMAGKRVSESFMLEGGVGGAVVLYRFSKDGVDQIAPAPPYPVTPRCAVPKEMRRQW